jgi:hypothetical protein
MTKNQLPRHGCAIKYTKVDRFVPHKFQQVRKLLMKFSYWSTAFIVQLFFSLFLYFVLYNNVITVANITYYLDRKQSKKKNSKTHTETCDVILAKRKLENSFRKKIDTDWWLSRIYTSRKFY